MFRSEHEYVELAENIGGCFVDLMSGGYMINPLEPKTWDEGGSPQDRCPIAFDDQTKPAYSFKVSSGAIKILMIGI